jgi:hypothetical protein
MAAANTNGEVVDNTIDKILAMELNQLSLEEREDINHEIHGVHTLAVPETPEFVTQKLEEMEDHLLKGGMNQPTSSPMVTQQPTHQPHHRPIAFDNVYEEALLLGSQYIHDRTFRIMFLRSELFDASKAASRLVRFLQLLRDYFGEQALLRLPYGTLQDLTADEIQFLKKGIIHVLPSRDNLGRRICGNFDDHSDIPAITMVGECAVWCSGTQQPDQPQKG